MSRATDWCPFGLRSLVDESLEGHSDIYFQGGDHRMLVHLSGELFPHAHGRICEIGVEDGEYFYGGA